MAEIFSFVEAKKSREPYMTGSATCIGCGHKWVAVAPVGTVSLECPECHVNHGRFIELVRDDAPHWTCNCGNQFFSITKQRTYCVVCGDTAVGF